MAEGVLSTQLGHPPHLLSIMPLSRSLLTGCPAHLHRPPTSTSCVTHCRYNLHVPFTSPPGVPHGGKAHPHASCHCGQPQIRGCRQPATCHLPPLTCGAQSRGEGPHPRRRRRPAAQSRQGGRPGRATGACPGCPCRPAGGEPRKAGRRRKLRGNRMDRRRIEPRKEGMRACSKGSRAVQCVLCLPTCPLTRPACAAAGSGVACPLLTGGHCPRRRCCSSEGRATAIAAAGTTSCSPLPRLLTLLCRHHTTRRCTFSAQEADGIRCVCCSPGPMTGQHFPAPAAVAQEAGEAARTAASPTHSMPRAPCRCSHSAHQPGKDPRIQAHGRRLLAHPRVWLTRHLWHAPLPLLPVLPAAASLRRRCFRLHAQPPLAAAPSDLLLKPACLPSWHQHRHAPKKPFTQQSMQAAVLE